MPKICFILVKIQNFQMKTEMNKFYMKGRTFTILHFCFFQPQDTHNMI